MKIKYEIIKFKDGRYALRQTKTLFGFIKKIYFISKYDHYPWNKARYIEEFCKGTLDQIEHLYDIFTDTGEIIK